MVEVELEILLAETDSGLRADLRAVSMLEPPHLLRVLGHGASLGWEYVVRARRVAVAKNPCPTSP